MSVGLRRTHQSRGHHYRGDEGYAPGRKPRIKVRSVVCPTCGADVDEWCRSADGNPFQGEQHRDRVRMATRAHNERGGDQDRADRDFIRSLTPKQRRALRRHAGILQGDLAESVGAPSQSTFGQLELGHTQPNQEWAPRYGAWLRERQSMSEESFQAALAGEVRARMGRRSMNGSQLADETGLAPSTLAKKIKGEVTFTVTDLEAVAKALDTSIQNLILSVRVPA